MGRLEPDQLHFVAELVKGLQANWQDLGLIAPVEPEASYAPKLVLFVPVESDDRNESEAVARAAVTEAREQVERELAIGPDGYDPVNTNRSVVADQIHFDGGYRRVGQIFVRARHGALGRLANELEVPAQVVRGAIWSVARGTSSRVIIPNPPEPQLPAGHDEAKEVD